MNLLLATKTVPAKKILIALKAGENLIAENKVQELKEKFETLKAIPHQTHFIGHLQTNKIKEVINYVQCIQSLDRLELVEKLHNRKTAQDQICSRATKLTHYKKAILWLANFRRKKKGSTKIAVWQNGW